MADNIVPTNVPAKPGADVEPDIDYEKAFKVLCAAFGREMISSTALYFALMAVKERCGEDAARVGAEHMALNRDKSTQDFMG